jgi:hypothetical protein
MLPSIGDESDYGSLAQKMLDDLFNPSTPALDDFADSHDPPSPSPAGDVQLGAQMLRTGSGDVSSSSPTSPVSPSIEISATGETSDRVDDVVVSTRED